MGSKLHATTDVVQMIFILTAFIMMSPAKLQDLFVTSVGFLFCFFLSYGFTVNCLFVCRCIRFFSVFSSPSSSQICRKRVEITRQNRELSFLSCFPLRLSDPRFCCVTDDFNYLLTLRTQQIHMINGVGDCCSHHLDEAKEYK